ncbi:unnamed protein product, partial [marine sediment metagenome]
MLQSVYASNKDRKGIKEIIEVMGKVDRKYFVKSPEPYIDAPIFIGYGQT